MAEDMLNGCLHILKMARNPFIFPYIVAPVIETIVEALQAYLETSESDGRER